MFDRQEKRSTRRHVLVTVVAAATLVVSGQMMSPDAAYAVPSSITFPVSATKSVIESQSPLRWCFASQANCHHDYNAADIFAPTGTSVVSPVGGTVISATHASSGVGSRVQIRDDQGDIWYLAHMHHSPGLRVSQGQRVERGTGIGYVGTSAHAVGTQPHLHIDMLPPPYTSRPSCSGSACSGYPFYNLQPLLIAAYNGGGSPSEPPPGAVSVFSLGEGDGHVFARLSDGSLGQWWHTSTGWRFTSLGGELAPGSSPAAYSNGPGHAAVFARASNNNLLQYYHDSAGWHLVNLGGAITSSPAVISNGPGHATVFARGAGGGLVNYLHRPGAEWVFAGVGGQVVGSPAAVTNGPGLASVFFRNPNNNLMQFYHDSAGWHSSNLGGAISNSPAAFTNGPGHATVFVRSGNGILWNFWHVPGQPWASSGIAGGRL
jgi:Peptidase family M23